MDLDLVGETTSTKADRVRISDLPEQIRELHDFASRTNRDWRPVTQAGPVEVTHLFAGHPFASVELLFDIPNTWEVISYLEQRPTLVTPLRRTYSALRDIFENEPLRLEVYRDPEGELDSELAIYIETMSEPSEALAKLDKFDETFWFEHLEEYEPHFSVNLDYR